MTEQNGVAAGPTSQTLERGILVLRLLADSPDGMTTAQIANALGLHRTIVYRIVNTMAKYGLIGTGPDQRHVLGGGILELARGVHRDLQAVARAVLPDLAEQTLATANFAVPDGSEVLVLAVVEPKNASAHIAYQAGQRHPITTGSAGLAILAARRPAQDERPEVVHARSRGYAVSHGEVIPGVIGVSMAVVDRHGEPIASVGVTVFKDSDIDDRLIGALGSAAQRIAEGTL
ncbi:IclR family transcriptional regulator [Dactylosporangium sp. CA-233914]|uniref:IclR family transcriptional regulator n=1 Tax=Dactylosporangium sp. CA-233914 TaxID=3239934 RepID=UPI003D91FFB9